MKARAKVLVGLLVVLAMMIVASPAMAQEIETAGDQLTVTVEETQDWAFKTGENAYQLYVNENIPYKWAATAAGGSGSYTYQWQKKNEENQFIDFSSPTPSDNNTLNLSYLSDVKPYQGVYRCKVTDSAQNEGYSAEITITVSDYPSLSIQGSTAGRVSQFTADENGTSTIKGLGYLPVSNFNQNLQLTAVTPNGTPRDIKWYKGGRSLYGIVSCTELVGTGNTYTIPAADLKEDAHYKVTADFSNLDTTKFKTWFDNNATLEYNITITKARTDPGSGYTATVEVKMEDDNEEYTQDTQEHYDYFYGAHGRCFRAAVTSDTNHAAHQYEYQWQKDGKDVMAYGISIYNSEKDSWNEGPVLNLTSLLEDRFRYEGSYQCLVMDHGVVVGKSKPFSVTIYDAPTLEMRTSPESPYQVGAVSTSTGYKSNHGPVKGKFFFEINAANQGQPLTLEATAHSFKNFDAGQTESMEVSPSAYRWYKNNRLIEGATGASYTIPASDVRPDNVYKVEADYANLGYTKKFMVDCEFEEQNNQQVEVRVNDHDDYVSREADKLYEYLSRWDIYSLTFEAVADLKPGTNNPDLQNQLETCTYHWQKNGSDTEINSDMITAGKVFGKANAGLNLSHSYKYTDEEIAGDYQCIVKNSRGEEIGRSKTISIRIVNSASLNIKEADGESSRYGSGPTGTIKVDAKDKNKALTLHADTTGAEAYQWYLNGYAIKGAADDHYTIAAGKLKNDDEYSVQATYNIGDRKYTINHTATIRISGEGDQPDTPSDGQTVAYRTHVQNVGWQPYVTGGTIAGTSGKSLRLEAMNIKVQNKQYVGDIEYRTHIQNIGWENEWKKNGAMSGTSNRSLRLEAMQVRLTGAMADKYDVYYRVHAENFGWLGWAKNGEQSGTAGYGYRLEAMQIMLVDKGDPAPNIAPNAQQEKAFLEKYKDNVKADSLIAYQTHVQNVGWQNYAVDGGDAGTSGQSLRLEGMKIYLNNPKYTGDIEYRTHIQNIGWENQWKKNDAMSGTNGRALRLEAMQVKLTGEMANHYDVYYRVHAQNFGWLGWAKNGEQSGTAGYAYRLEAMQIALVDKGGAAPNLAPPSNDSRAYIDKNARPAQPDEPDKPASGRAVLDTGSDVNVAIKQLSDRNAQHTYDNNDTIKSIVRADHPAPSGAATVNLSTTSVPVTAWWDADSQTVYWYSTDAKPMLNADCTYMFTDLIGAERIDLSHFDTSNVTDMTAMFQSCESVAALDVSAFDTSNVKTMDFMFNDCRRLTALDVSRFNTSKVTDMDAMFFGCEGLTALDVSTFNTSKVTSMSSMFAYCKGLTALDVSRFNTSKVTEMDTMFAGCEGLTTLDLSTFDTSNVTNMEGMFRMDVSDGSHQLTSLDLSGFDTSKVTKMNSMFRSNVNLKTIYASDKFSIANVEDGEYMFSDCMALVGGNGTAWVQKTDHSGAEYARIDKAGQPGFFTQK